MGFFDYVKQPFQKGKFWDKKGQEIDKETNDDYSKEDLEKWEAGGQRFARFWQAGQYLKDIYYGYFEDQGIKVGVSEWRNLQLLFLGEKPVMCSGPMVQACGPTLIDFGFQICGDYIYSVELLQRQIEEHRDIFLEQVGTDDANEVFGWLGRVRQPDFFRGVLFGYPVEASRKFQKYYDEVRIAHEFENKAISLGLFEYEDIDNLSQMVKVEKIFKDNKQLLGIGDEQMLLVMEALKKMYLSPVTKMDSYGAFWRDFDPVEEESFHKQKRWKLAFEKSGILEIDITADKILKVDDGIVI